MQITFVMITSYLIVKNQLLPCFLFQWFWSRYAIRLFGKSNLTEIFFLFKNLKIKINDKKNLTKCLVSCLQTTWNYLLKERASRLRLKSDFSTFLPINAKLEKEHGHFVFLMKSECIELHAFIDIVRCRWHTIRLEAQSLSKRYKPGLIWVKIS